MAIGLEAHLQMNDNVALLLLDVDGSRLTVSCGPRDNKKCVWDRNRDHRWDVSGTKPDS